MTFADSTTHGPGSPATYAGALAAGLREPALVMACGCAGREGFLERLTAEGRRGKFILGREGGRDYVWLERGEAAGLLLDVLGDGAAEAASALAPTTPGEFWFASLLHGVLRIARLRQRGPCYARASAPVYFEQFTTAAPSTPRPGPAFQQDGYL